MNEKDIKLTDEEKEILDTYEAGEWQSVDGKNAEMSNYQEYARATHKKDKRVNE